MWKQYTLFINQLLFWNYYDKTSINHGYGVTEMKIYHLWWRWLKWVKTREVERKTSSTKCSIGIFLIDVCQKLTWSNYNIGVYTKDDLSQVDLKLIELRSDVNNTVNVCCYHNGFYMKKYTMQQKNVAIHLRFPRKL